MAKSGGYPFKTDSVFTLKKFRSAEEADRYRQVDGNSEGFTIHIATLSINTQPVEV